MEKNPFETLRRVRDEHMDLISKILMDAIVKSTMGGLKMTNLEKHREEIEKELTSLPESSCIKLAELREDSCNNHVSCRKCTHSLVDWLLEEPKVDWSQIKSGTKCLVRDYEDSSWIEREFAVFAFEKPWFFSGGSSIDNMTITTSLQTYNYCKLKEDEN